MLETIYAPGSLSNKSTHIFFMLLCLLEVNLSGCGVHFHNAANEAQARKASDSFKAADVGKYIEAERQVVQTTHERNLTALRRHSSAERDRLIAKALTEGINVGFLKEKIDDRMGEIGFPNDKTTRLILSSIQETLLNALVARDRYLVSINESPNVISSPSFPPSDADEKAAKSSGNDHIQYIFSNYKKNSDKYFNDIIKLKSLKNGEIGKLNVQLVEIGTFNVTISQEIVTANQKLKSSLEEYEKEIASGKKTSDELKSSQKKIEDALGKFDKIVADLEPAAKQLGVEDLLAEIRLEQLKTVSVQLGKFLESYSKAESDKTGVTSETNATNAEVAGKVASVITGMAKEIQDSSTEAKLVPLMFEQQRLRLEIARVQKMSERGKQRISLLEEQRNAYVAEGMKLMDAKGLLTLAVGENDDSVLLVTLFKKENKEYLLRAVIRMCQSIAVDKRHERETEVALITLDHDEALDSSEFSLGLWKIMIASPLEQLVSYHTSGITSDDVSKLLQAASLAGIAIGVNR